MLFPLPLSPFERYYLADDSREYPTAFPALLHFSGRLEPDAVRGAFRRALERHPLLNALVDDSGKRPAWVASSRDEAWIDWNDADAPITHPDGEYIGLRKEPGLRVFVRASATAATVLIQIHHACCDGLAAFQFISDFLAYYKLEKSDPEAVEPEPLDVGLLADRGRIVDKNAPRPPLPIFARDIFVALYVWAYLGFIKPVALAAPRHGDENSRSVPRPDDGRPILEFETDALSREETNRFRQVAAALGVTQNDLLLRDLFLSLDAWNQRHGKGAGGRMWINMPVNVRSRADLRLPAANRIGFGFIPCDGSERHDAKALLDLVYRETQHIKKDKMALYFLGGLEFAAGVPGMLRWALGRNKSFATAVMSNIGRFTPERSAPRGEHWACGELVLKSLTGAPPIRKLTRAAVLGIEYGGHMRICVRCDRHYFSAADMRELLDDYAQRIRATIERGG